MDYEALLGKAPLDERSVICGSGWWVRDLQPVGRHSNWSNDRDPWGHNGPGPKGRRATGFESIATICRSESTKGFVAPNIVERIQLDVETRSVFVWTYHANGRRRRMWTWGRSVHSFQPASPRACL